MSANSMLSVNLTTLAAGIVAPLQNNVGLPALVGGCIPPNCFYTQITTSTATNNSISLPVNPILNQPYTIVNDGAATVQVWAGSTVSTINGVVTAGTTTVPFYVGAGLSATFIATSNNQAANTAAVTLALNNPLVLWQTSSLPAQATNIYTVLTGATTASAVLPNAATSFTLVSGTTYIVPAMAGTCAVTLPANAASAGVNYKFIMNGTVGNAMTLTAATATTIKGVYGLSGGIVIKTAATTAVITATAVAGDQLTIVGDGTNWYVNGIGSAAASFS